MDLDTCEAFKCEFLQATGRRNKPVYGHKAVLIGHSVYVWGGYHETKDKKRFSILDLRTNTWTIKRVTNHFGDGQRVRVMFVQDDFIYALAFRKGDASAFFVKIDALFLDEVFIEPTHGLPDLHFGCAGAFLEEMKDLVVVGARGAVFALNIGVLSWKEIPTSGQGPISERGHACCSYRNILYVAGGVPRGDCLDLHILAFKKNSCSWSKPKVTLGSKLPTPKTDLTLTCSGPDRIFAIGGTYNIRLGDEFSMFSFRKNQWFDLKNQPSSSSDMECKGDKKQGTSYHAAVHTKDFLLVLGGFGMFFWMSTPMMIKPASRS